MAIKDCTPPEIRAYIEACDEGFCTGWDTPEHVRRAREKNYHLAWVRLLDAGYIPDDTDSYRVI